MVVGLGPDLDFLDLHHGLAFFGFRFLLLLLVLELAVIHDPADGRLRGGSHFHQIHAPFFSQGNGLVALQNSQLFTVRADNAHLARADQFVTAHAVLRHFTPRSHIRRSYSASLLV